MPIVHERSRFARSSFVAVAAATAVAIVSAVSVAGAPRALAADDGWNRAVVVVDTGDGVKSACVRFRAASITGVELLRTGRMDPEVRSFSGNGAAVCKLCGVGCNAGNQCLTCQSPKYWQYHQAPAGSSGYTYAQNGAGTSDVRDGDVEGWSWSAEKDPPPFLTVASVCSDPARTFDYTPPPPQASSQSSTTTQPPPTTTTGPAAAPTTAAPSPTAAPRSLVTTTTQVLSTTTSVVVVPDPSDAGPAPGDAANGPTDATVNPDEYALDPKPTDADPAVANESNPLAVALLALIVALLGGQAVRVRRRRSHSATPGPAPGTTPA